MTKKPSTKMEHVELKQEPGETVYHVRASYITDGEMETLDISLGGCSESVAQKFAAVLDDVALDGPSESRPFKTKVTVSIEEISPRLALQYLTCNNHNRAVSGSRVDRYARILDQRAWSLTGEAIIFDEDGALVNGQHRLWACVSSNKPLVVVVVRGVEPDVIRDIDQGLSRSVGAWLDYNSDFEGTSSGKILGPILKFVIDLAAGQNNHSTSDAVHKTGKFYKTSLQWWSSLDRDPVILRSAWVNASLLISHRVYPDETAEFARRLILEEFEGHGDPVKILSQYIRAKKPLGAYTEPGTIIRFRALEALKAFIEGVKITGGVRDKKGFRAFPESVEGQSYRTEILEFFGGGKGRLGLIPNLSIEKFRKKGGPTHGTKYHVVRGETTGLPTFKERLRIILGTESKEISEIIAELKARKWEPDSKKLNIYVSAMLSDNPDDFERVGRGIYKNRRGLSLVG